MAIQGSGITFWPIYWVFNDCWRYYYQHAAPGGGITTTQYDHAGHVHLFLMGFDWAGGTQDAWSGKQTYKFEAIDLWGPRSQDPNQQYQYTVVGTPKWYFRVEELWRRVYIQPWDLKVETQEPEKKRGIKYDCGASDKRFGPFREGRDFESRREFAPVFLKYARTIPIDYYQTSALSQLNTVTHYIRGGFNAGEDSSKWYGDTTPSGGPLLGPYDTQGQAEDAAGQWLINNPHDEAVTNRSNWLGDMAAEKLQVDAPGTNPAYNPRLFNARTYDLQHGNYLYAGGLPGTEPHPAARPFSDLLFAQPLMEYQHVVQLDWTRLPGAVASNDIDADHFGDGWSVSVELPLKDPGTKLYRSPFCPPGTRTVMPIGQYYNGLVSDARKQRYSSAGYDDPNEPPLAGTPFYYDTPEKLHPSKSGSLIQWNNPYGDNLDGRWVQMFLGGMVQAKCEVTIQHKFGGRETIWINSTQYLPQTAFAGRDQAAPV